MNMLKKEAGAENGGSTGIDFKVYCTWLIGRSISLSAWLDFEVMEKMLKVKKGETVELRDFSE